MVKWIAYIVLLLIFTPYLSPAKIKNYHFSAFSARLEVSLPVKQIVTDTVTTKNNKKQELEDKKKIKEVTRAKKQPMPEKIELPDKKAALKAKQKPKRERRPEGLERPPEIPRRNGN